ncbi:PspA/IM30 family protein, partial [Rhizobium leguminosarum]|uniref:PspA/IM30 family protein n=1 Tax=Rhizobium leguminosarum TaxID=384 RepID=UPI003F99704C
SSSAIFALSCLSASSPPSAESSRKGNEGLAREAAEEIAYLEAERDASEKAQAQFTGAIEKLKGIVRASEARLQELQRGERMARATQEAQKL